MLALLLLSGLLLTWANSALAANLIVDGAGHFESLTTLNPAATDTITVRGGATLVVDRNQTLAGLTVGDGTTPGKVEFDGTARTLTVNGNVNFGAFGGNFFLMPLGIFAPQHQLLLSGSFLDPAKGTFQCGNSTVTFTAGSGTQTITALTYNNVTTTGGGTKSFATGVTVEGILTITGGQPAGADGAVIYGPTASLLYNGTGSQTTSVAEWKSGAVGMTRPVTIANTTPTSVKLDADKTSSGTLTVSNTCHLNDNGKMLTIKGTMVNNGRHYGTGKVLAGNVAGVKLEGTGSYGNVELIGPNNVTLDGTDPAAPALPKIAGRLTITSGKLVLPGGKDFRVSLLFYEGADREPNTYGATSAPAAVQDNDVFQVAGVPSGRLTVLAKATGEITFNSSFPKDQTITYGDPSITIKGHVDPGTSPAGVPFGLYGNGARPGDKIWVTINPPPSFSQVQVQVVLDGSLDFSATVPTATLPSCFRAEYPQAADLPPRQPGNQFANWAGPVVPFDVIVKYDQTTPEPLNLDGKEFMGSLLVNRRYVVVKPTIVTKVYGTPDPLVQECPSSSMSLPFDFIPADALQNGDSCIGSIGRQPGEDVGAYAFTLGDPEDAGAFNLSLDYDMWFNPEGNSFTICQKEITITPLCNQQKVYGTLPDPELLFTFTPPLAAWDTLVGVKQGALTRDQAGLYPPVKNGERVGQYDILLGNLSFGKNYKLTFGPLPSPCNKFTITPLQVTVTGRSDFKLYGEPDSCGTNDVTAGVKEIKRTSDNFVFVPGAGLPFGDTTTGSPARSPGENAGNYNVLQDDFGLVPANCYQITWVNGTFTIGKRPLNVEALCKTIYYGDDIPTMFAIETKNGTCAQARGLLPGDPPPVVNVNWANPPGTPVACTSLPGNYPFTLTAPVNANYAISLNPNACSLTICKAPLVIAADHKTKCADCYDCEPIVFTHTIKVLKNGQWITGLSCPSDTLANSLPPHGLIGFKDDFVGNAVTATKPGVWEIRPYVIGNEPPVSPKYAITIVPGYLTITPQTLAKASKFVGDTTWAGCDTNVPSLTWFASDPGYNSIGTAGGDPGWSLLTVTGTVTIVATPACPFRLDLVTLGSTTPDCAVPGRMCAFDPTRPYKWMILHTTGGIVGFDPAAIVINYNGAPLPPGLVLPAPSLFANPMFGGKFSVNVIGNDMYLYFTPVGPTGWGSSSLVSDPPLNPILPGYVNNGSVGPITDPTTLLGDVTRSCVPTLYLQPAAGSGALIVQPDQPLTINLNVANLGTTDIYGCQAYIAFNSLFFKANQTGPGAPQVAPGGGVWQNLIFRQWNGSGEMDTIIGIQFNQLAQTGNGTHDDATVAKITLTPTRTAVGTSRVVFRHDGDPYADGSGALETALIALPGETKILPARVMSDEITVYNSAGPVVHSITAVQSQPYSDINAALPALVDVKNGPPGAKVAVRTFAGLQNAEATTASGPVIITIDADDNGGVGLVGEPTLVLTGPWVVDSTVPGSGLVCINPGVTGPFVYHWTVPVGADGTWTASGTVSDYLVPPITVPLPPFTIEVNTHQVACVVEVQNFAGANRVVTFKAGDGSLPAGVLKTWTPNLNFISGPILDAGAYQNRTGMVARLSPVIPNVATTPYASMDTLSIWLRYGSFPNLPGVVDRLRLERPAPSVHKAIDEHLNYLLYGRILNLPGLNLWTLATRLFEANVNTRIEFYAWHMLSPATQADLAAYLAAWPNVTPAQDAALRAGILDDFNKMVVGPALWDSGTGVGDTDTLRFEGIAGLDPLGPAQAATLATATTAQQNRMLLRLAFLEYIPGMLNAWAASALTDNAKGLPTPALEALLLKAFDDVTLNAFQTPEWAGRTTMWPAGQVAFPGLYNQPTFVGVYLEADTTAQLMGPPLVGPALTQLNQNLLRDAYKEHTLPAMYEEPKLRPDTVLAILNFIPAVPASVTLFDALMQRDLNVVIYGPSIWDNGAVAPYSSKRFAQWQNFISPELAALIANPAPSAAQLVRMNRLLLELGYNIELSKSVLAPFVLVNAPPTATEISAKTDWNLRETLTGLAYNGNNEIHVDFVNAGNEAKVLWSPLVDHYLRGGDVSEDNVVSLSDFNSVRVQYNTANSDADINGDGIVNIIDYMIMKVNWAKTGDAEVK